MSDSTSPESLENGNGALNEDELDSEALRHLIGTIAVRLGRLDQEAEVTRDDLRRLLKEHTEFYREFVHLRLELKTEVSSIKGLLTEILGRLPEDALKNK